MQQLCFLSDSLRRDGSKGASSMIVLHIVNKINFFALTHFFLSFPSRFICDQMALNQLELQAAMNTIFLHNSILFLYEEINTVSIFSCW